MVIISEFFIQLAITIADLLPIVITLFVFHKILNKPIKHLKEVVIGIVFVVFGLSFFILGLNKALFPLGTFMANELTTIKIFSFKSEHLNEFLLIYIFAGLIGFTSTIAEPSLISIAQKAHLISGGVISSFGLRIAVAIGVSVGLVIGTYRIVAGDALHIYMIVGYLFVILQTRFTKKSIIPIAFDSGGVTTSTVTVPLIAALGIGLGEHIPGRDPLIDGFGLIAFASLFPIISVMAYANITSYLYNK